MDEMGHGWTDVACHDRRAVRPAPGGAGGAGGQRRVARGPRRTLLVGNGPPVTGRRSRPGRPMLRKPVFWAAVRCRLRRLRGVRGGQLPACILDGRARPRDGPRRRPWPRRGAWPTNTGGGPPTTGRRRAFASTTASAASSSWKGAAPEPSSASCAKAPSIPTSGSCGTSAAGRCARSRSASAPTGTPYGFRERLPEDAPGAVLDVAAARSYRGERDGPARPGTSRSTATEPVESSQGGTPGRPGRSHVRLRARRPAGRRRGASGCAWS